MDGSNGIIRFMAGSLKSGRPEARRGTLRVIDSLRRLWHENQPQEEKMKTSEGGGVGGRQNGDQVSSFRWLCDGEKKDHKSL